MLVGALLFSTALIALKPDPKPREVEATLPLVDVVIAQPGAQRMTVRAQGTLAPRDEIELVAEVAGRVVWISPSFDGAGEFAANEPLVRIAPDDYEIGAQRAQAAVARAESQLTLARAALEAIAIVDGNIKPKLQCPAYTVVKGDLLSMSIAAASIIAKTTRDRMMLELARDYPNYQWHSNKGYAAPAHREALDRYGVTPHHRRTFAPIHNMLYEASTKPLLSTSR